MWLLIMKLSSRYSRTRIAACVDTNKTAGPDPNSHEWSNYTQGPIHFSRLYTSYLLGDPVYMFLATASRVICVPVVFCSIVMLIICYYAQWPLIEYIWGPNNVKFTVNSHSFKSE